MRPINTRRAISDLTRLCKAHDLELIKISGKGSHQGLIFRDPKTNESVRLTIAGHKEISPGVQREVLKYTAGLGVRVALALVVREILASLFHYKD